jgi:hypothetical protein
MPDSSANNVFAVNRQIRGQDMIGIPDLRLGTNTISDVSLTPKNGLTDQLRRWNFIRKRPANPTLCKGIEGCEGCCFDNSEGAANGSGGMARQDQATTGRGSAVEAVRQKHCCVGAGPRDGCKAADGVGHL